MYFSCTTYCSYTHIVIEYKYRYLRFFKILISLRNIDILFNLCTFRDIIRSIWYLDLDKNISKIKNGSRNLINYIFIFFYPTIVATIHFAHVASHQSDMEFSADVFRDLSRVWKEDARSNGKVHHGELGCYTVGRIVKRKKILKCITCTDSFTEATFRLPAARKKTASRFFANRVGTTLCTPFFAAITVASSSSSFCQSFITVYRTGFVARYNVKTRRFLRGALFLFVYRYQHHRLSFFFKPT